MPYLNTINEWLRQSDQLIRAYPTTTRITTKYSLAVPSDKSRKRKRTTGATGGGGATGEEDTATASTPRATLTLKTFDPESGACLQYKTDQAAEANRLVRSLSALGQGMAGLEVDVDAVLDAPTQQQQQQTLPIIGKEAVTDVAGDKGTGDGAGKKKKKKGKK